MCSALRHGRARLRCAAQRKWGGLSDMFEGTESVNSNMPIRSSVRRARASACKHWLLKRMCAGDVDRTVLCKFTLTAESADFFR